MQHRILFQIALLLLLVCAPTLWAKTPLPGLDGPVRVVRDSNGIPHISATSVNDAYYLQGRVHAEDRLFQMDLFRRQADGTLAEVLGAAALEQDVVARTIGLDRAARRSLAAHPETVRESLEAYSDGVNAFLDAAEAKGMLPVEYAALGLAKVRRWTPLDSVLVSKALGATTSLLVSDDIDLTLALAAYELNGQFAGFDGTALFFEDLFRSAPFDPASTVPDAERSPHRPHPHQHPHDWHHSDDHGTLKRGRGFTDRLRKLPRHHGFGWSGAGDMGGSNTWVIAGEHTQHNGPLLANDMHLALNSPTIFHQIHLQAPGLDVIGSGVAGAPCLLRGHNRHIAWGITNARLDVSDIYRDQIVMDPSGTFPAAIVHQGAPELIVPVPQQFFVNPLDGTGLVPVTEGVPPAVFTVPRRNHGPLITPPAPDAAGVLRALTLQSTGFSATRDLEGLCAMNRARNLDEFKAALRLVDFASQNVSYADRRGNVAYFTTGEVPLREDLQAMNPLVPPFLIREGTGGQEWVVAGAPLPDDQAVPYQILPFDEMPQTVNPPRGFIVNSNNDQVGNTLDNNPLNDPRPGGGLRYLNWGGRNFSIRAGRVDDMLSHRIARGESISMSDMKTMQADTVLGDAKELAPYIIAAYRNSRRYHAHPALAAYASDWRVAKAVQRLKHWGYTTPTGLKEGYDADTGWHARHASVAASIYSVWRGRVVANTIDAVLDAVAIQAVLDGLGLDAMPRPRNREEVVTALRHLVEHDGLSASGLNFFNVPGVDDPATRRDIVLLQSLREALDLMASDAFAPAFANSTDLDDYRWGKLHRIEFPHPLGGVDSRFNVPPAFGLFPPPLPGLAGIPVDGGFETVDEGPPRADIRVTDSDSMMFRFGPTGRFVSRLGRHRVRAQSSLPGGESAVATSPFYLNLLEPWLNNEAYPLRTSRKALAADAYSIHYYVPMH